MKEALTPSNIVLLLGLLILSGLSIKLMLFNYRHSKKLKARAKELDEQKCKEPHEWLWMDMAGKSVNVCKKCCWCPTHEGYIMKRFIDAEISNQNFKKNLKEYTDKRLKELGVSEELYDKVINIKKDFALQHLDKVIKDMKLGE